METPPDTPSDDDRARPHWAVPLGLGAVYGLTARLAFALDQFDALFGVMTGAFVFGVPIAMGTLAVLGQPREPRWAASLVLGWVPTLVAIGGTLLLAWEGLICVVIWLPVALLCATVGGLVGKLGWRSKAGRRPLGLLVAVLPLVVAPVENQSPLPRLSQTVHDAVEIEATPEAVWREIREVRPIRPDELGGSLAYRIGFPRPIEARLDGTGVGSVRHATFEGGVTFVERVTEWRRGRSLAFTIDASAVPSTTFDQHVAVGGRFFDVLNGRYEIERVAPGRVVLHLTSEQRLGTRFNAYTQLWTDRFMSDIQTTILGVIKRRAESSSVSGAGPSSRDAPPRAARPATAAGDRR